MEDVPLPDPQASELLIRLHAAGVNPIDWKMRAGYLRQVLALPCTLGSDFSGVVEAIGVDVAGFEHRGSSDADWYRTPGAVAVPLLAEQVKQ